MKFSVKWTTPQGFWGEFDLNAWDLTDATATVKALRGKRVPIDAEFTIENAK